MANCLLGFPNRIDTSTLSGGSYQATLPLDQLKNRELGQLARTTNLLAASTLVNIDLGQAKAVRVFGLINHNLSLTSTYRLRGSNDPTFAVSVYDSGVASDVWPVVYPWPVLEWEDDNWWSGRYSNDEIEGYTPSLIVVLPAQRSLRYWRLELFDSTNPAGYVQAGRIFIGPAWQPLKNASYGLGHGYETKTSAQEALGGAEFFQYRRPYRVTKFVLEYLDQNTGLAQALEMDRRAGVDKEVMWVQDPDDTDNAIRRRYLGRFRQLSMLEYPYYNTTSKAYEIKELR